MRAGQPKCVCALKCRSPKPLNKKQISRGDVSMTRNVQSVKNSFSKLKRNASEQRRNGNADSLSRVNGRQEGSNQRHRRLRKFHTNVSNSNNSDGDDQLISSDAQFIDPVNNRSIFVSTLKSDRIISIMASDSMQNLNSHRLRKSRRKNNTNNKFTDNDGGDSSLNSKIVDNSNLIGKNETMLMHHRDHSARKHNRNSKRGKQRMDDGNRSRQAQSWEDGPYGYDATYPSDNNPVRRNYKATCPIL